MTSENSAKQGSKSSPVAVPPYTTMDHLFRGISIAFALLYVINYFLNIRLLTLVGLALLMVILYQGILRMPKVNLYVVSGLFLAGTVVLIWCGAGVTVWINALMQNANLATIFTAAPLLALPFYYEDYQGELARAARAKMQHLLSFMFLMAICGHVLNLLVGVGAIAIAYEMFYPHSKLYHAEDLFYPSLTRNNCSSGFWAPAWASTVLVTSTTGTPWISIIPIGIAFAVVYVLMDMLILSGHIRRHAHKYPRLTPIAGETVNGRKILTMFLLAVIMLSMIALTNAGTGWSLMIVIPIVAIIFPLLTAVFQKHLPAYRVGLSKYYRNSVLRVRPEIALFTAAGFLGKALEVSGIGQKIPALLPNWLHDYPVLMILALMLMIILPSLVGIHAVAIGTAMLTALTPVAVGMNQMTFVMTILTGWMLSILLSPFSAVSLIASGYAGYPSWVLSLKKNGPFGLLCLVVFSLLIYLICPWL